jgi:hypothetical protein
MYYTLDATQLCKKGSMHEIFKNGVFTQIRPVRVGDLGIGQKNQKFMFGAFYFNFYQRIFLAIQASSLKIKLF